jgi:hypothetical protein
MFTKFLSTSDAHRVSL